MAGIVYRDGRPTCATCSQPVEATAFVCLGCGAALQDPSGTIAHRSPPPPAGPAFAAPPPATNPWDGPSSPSPTDSSTLHIRLPQPPTSAAPVEAAASADAADDRTVVVARRPKAEWALRLPSGERVHVDEVLLLGRRPLASVGPQGARLVPVDDPARTVSRSHLVIEPQPGSGILLRDVSSANGIVVIAADGSETEVAPGGEVRITQRCSIVLGAFEIGIEPV